MTTGNDDALSAVVARQRGRARLRTVTVAFGAAGLVAAGVVAYHLPSATTSTASAHSTTAVTSTGGGTTAVVHTTSGGSGVVTPTTTSNGRTVTVPVSGAAHATSGGS